MPDEQFPKLYLYRRIVQAKLFMDARYAGHIQLDAIADEAFFSKFHFIRLFRQVYGKTPHQYLMQVRVEQARLLLKTDLPVADVCIAVGFDSISSFTGLFKKLTGATPSAYQLAQRLRKEDIKAAPLKYIPHCFATARGWTQSV